MRRHAERAVAQWLRSFDQQGVGMATLLLARVKQYWEGQVDALLAERVAEVDELVRQMQAAPQEKAVRLAALRAEAEALRAVVGELA